MCVSQLIDRYSTYTTQISSTYKWILVQVEQKEPLQTHSVQAEGDYDTAYFFFLAAT